MRSVSARRLVVILFEDAEHATGALAALADLADDRVLTLADAAVVVRRRADDGGAGAVEVRQAKELAAGEGVVGGGAVGLLVGLATGLPVAAALVGMAGGAGIAALDTGIPNDELRRVGESLGAGGAAARCRRRTSCVCAARSAAASTRRGSSPPRSRGRGQSQPGFAARSFGHDDNVSSKLGASR
jgi:uncharacterized membrane protein